MALKHYVLGVMGLLLVACSEDEVVISEGFERMGGEANVHFVYLNKSIYKGGKYEQQVDSTNLCALYGHIDSCEVYIWTNKERVATQLPVEGRDKDVGLFRLSNGVTSFKQVHQEEPIYDVYEVDVTQSKTTTRKGKNGDSLGKEELDRALRILEKSAQEGLK